MVEPTSLMQLPRDVMLLILECLDDVQNILQLSQVSKSFHALVHSVSVSYILYAAASKDIPLQDPRSLAASEPTDDILRGRLKDCFQFHAAWSQSAAPSVSTSVVRMLPIEAGICMIRVLPGGRFIVVIDFEEQATFYRISTGEKVAHQGFNEVCTPEIIYSIDFAAKSRSEVIWGVLTSDTNPGNDNAMLCARVFVITMPEPEDTDQALRFEKKLQYRFMGSAEMLSISSEIVSLYTYKHGRESPELLVWDWVTGRQAEHSILWDVLRDDGRYAGHPSLHSTPSAIFLVGGLLGWHRLHPVQTMDTGDSWGYNRATQVKSPREDAEFLRYSSQGRCSKPWWNVKRSWHRLVSYPSHGDDLARPIKIFSFEVPNSPEDKEARRYHIELEEKTLVIAGFESSPQLYHSSRFGSKALWLSTPEDAPEDDTTHITVQSVSLPAFEKGLNGEKHSRIKEIILDPKINKASIRAFDVDETVPLIAFAEANKVWLLKVNGSSEPIGESADRKSVV